MPGFRAGPGMEPTEGCGSSQGAGSQRQAAQSLLESEDGTLPSGVATEGRLVAGVGGCGHLSALCPGPSLHLRHLFPGRAAGLPRALEGPGPRRGSPCSCLSPPCGPAQRLRGEKHLCVPSLAPAFCQVLAFQVK